MSAFMPSYTPTKVDANSSGTDRAKMLTLLLSSKNYDPFGGVGDALKQPLKDRKLEEDRQLENATKQQALDSEVLDMAFQRQKNITQSAKHQDAVDTRFGEDFATKGYNADSFFDGEDFADQFGIQNPNASPAATNAAHAQFRLLSAPNAEQQLQLDSQKLAAERANAASVAATKQKYEMAQIGAKYKNRIKSGSGFKSTNGFYDYNSRDTTESSSLSPNSDSEARNHYTNSLNNAVMYAKGDRDMLLAIDDAALKYEDADGTLHFEDLREHLDNITGKANKKVPDTIRDAANTLIANKNK